MIDIGILKRIKSIMNKYKDNDDIIFECLWILTNIASGTRIHCEAIVKNGFMDYIFYYCESQNINIREQAIWCLGNLLGEKQQLNIPYDKIKKVMVENISNASFNVRSQLAWALSNVFRNSLSFNDEEIILLVLRQLAIETERNIISELLWATSYVSNNEGQIQFLIDNNLFELCLRYMDRCPNICVRNIGNLILGTDENVDLLFEKGLYQVLDSQLTNNPKEIIWMCSNLCVGPLEHKLHVFKLLNRILNILNDPFNTDLIKDFWWLIKNMFDRTGLDISKINREHLLETLFQPSIYFANTFSMNVKLQTILTVLCYDHKSSLKITPCRMEIPFTVLEYHSKLLKTSQSFITQLNNRVSHHIASEVASFLYTLP
jgi:hypothetical protein